MRKPRPRRELRLKESGDKEAAVRQLHGACLPHSASRAYAQTGRLKLLLVLFVHAVVAVVLLGVIFGAENRPKQRPSENLQRFVARAFRFPDTAVRESTGKRCDNAVFGRGIVLRGVSAVDVQDVTRIL